jgi:hypothetical protein
VEREGSQEWKLYRTRFLVRARQLTSDMTIIDASGREQCGREGDYVVVCSDGTKRIAPRQIFEDVYVIMETAAPTFSIPHVLRRSNAPQPDSGQPPLFSLTG